MSNNIRWHTLAVIPYSDFRIFAKSKLQFTLGSDYLLLIMIFRRPPFGIACPALVTMFRTAKSNSAGSIRQITGSDDRRYSTMILLLSAEPSSGLNEVSAALISTISESRMCRRAKVTILRMSASPRVVAASAASILRCRRLCHFHAIAGYTRNDREQIAEVMSNSSSELTDRLHLHGVYHLRLGLLAPPSLGPLAAIASQD